MSPDELEAQRMALLERLDREARDARSWRAMAMTIEPSLEDRIAAWELMGCNGPKPALLDPKPQSDWTDAYRMMEVMSSDGTRQYHVEERPDTRNGGRYYHCTCLGWVRQLARGQDCRHVKVARGLWVKQDAERAAAAPMVKSELGV